MPNRAASSSPIPSLNSALSTENWCWATRCSLPIPPASGRATHMRPAKPRTLTTNSTYVTIWRRFTGTNSRRPPRCLPKSPIGPVKSTGKRTGCSPGRIYELAGLDSAVGHRGLDHSQFPHWFFAGIDRVDFDGRGVILRPLVLRFGGGVPAAVRQLEGYCILVRLGDGGGIGPVRPHSRRRLRCCARAIVRRGVDCGDRGLFTRWK